jgi:hypothetical protein
MEVDAVSAAAIPYPPPPESVTPPPDDVPAAVYERAPLPDDAGASVDILA